MSKKTAKDDPKFSGVFTTKTFWAGMVTVVSGVSALLGSDMVFDFSSVSAIGHTIQAVASSPAMNTILLGVAMIFGRHAVAKANMKMCGRP